jgi:predicted phage terminase large subunit-like protein
MSRQHPDDPIGRRLARTKVKWEYLHRPAIIDLGLETERAFAPNVWDLDQIKRTREEWREQDPYERLFWSRYQGEPRLEGATYFGEPSYYSTLPTWPGFREAIGIDVSYTSGRASDWFAIVVARFYGNKCYILNVTRFKPDPTEVPEAIRGQMAVCAGPAPLFSYASGGDAGVAGRLAADHGISISMMQAKENKLWRSTRTIARWNAGDILLPANAPWVTGFVKRMKEYSGNERSDEDDEVDALVSVVEAMLGLVSGEGPGTVGRRRM